MDIQKKLWLFFTDLLDHVLGRYSPITYVATECGHTTKRTGEVTCTDIVNEIRARFGYRTYTLHREVDGSFRYCLKCTGLRSACCALCGEFIIDGDTVYLISIAEKSHTPIHRRAAFFDKRTHARLHRDDVLTSTGTTCGELCTCGVRDTKPLLVICAIHTDNDSIRVAGFEYEGSGVWVIGQDGRGTIRVTIREP